MVWNAPNGAERGVRTWRSTTSWEKAPPRVVRGRMGKFKKKLVLSVYQDHCRTGRGNCTPPKGQSKGERTTGEKVAKQAEIMGEVRCSVWEPVLVGAPPRHELGRRRMDSAH